ncbi:MAG: bile acid:sodium symporter family protein, partial [Woeseia sp.]|jgi:bile acid:Na+ symporter, BASS family|nr:bile acid:sodium symporter family protein [Woeseia sp.]
MDAQLGLAIPILVFVFTIGIGTDLTWGDFKRLLSEPGVILAGICGHILLLPALAFAIAYIFREDLIIAIGIVLLAACPGGPLSNSLVYVARARTELSVTLTAISGFISLVTTPIIAWYGIRLFVGDDADMSLPILPTVMQIFVVMLVPLTIGMFVRTRWPDMVARNTQKIRMLCTVLMLLAILIVVVLSWTTLTGHFAQFALAGLVFVGATLLISWFYGGIIGLDESSRFTMMVEISIRNPVIASLIAITLLDRPEFALFSAVYAAPAAVIILALGIIRARRNKRKPNVGSDSLNTCAPDDLTQ